jgi:hypothetical protein
VGVTDTARFGVFGRLIEDRQRLVAAAAMQRREPAP